MSEREKRPGDRAWLWIRVVLVLLLVGLLVGRQCSRGSTNGPAAADQSEGAAIGSAVFMVQVRVLELDAAALETDEGARLLAFGGSILGPEPMKLPMAAAATLISAGSARFVSSPRLMVNEGQAGTIGVERSTPGGGGGPRTTRNDTLEVVCTIEEDGRVRVNGVLRAEQQTGEIEHAASELGVPLGDRALVSVDVGLASGETAIGSKRLGARNELGGALVLMVTPVLVEPKADE